MSRLTIHTVESAPEAAQARVATALKNNGFLPNLIGVLANAPTALEMYQEVGAINAMNAQIASVSVQQSAAAEEVAQNVTRIHRSTVQSAAGSEQVENSNHELAELADRLSTKVAFFNVA